MRYPKSLTLASLFLLATAGHAESPFDGHWVGAIELPTGELEIDVDFESDEKGALSGDISIPVQALEDVALEGIEVDGSEIRFLIPGIPGAPTFDGELEGEETLAGTFTQGGASLSFALAREDAAAQALAALEGLDVDIEQALEDFNVPGLGIAVVAGGEVVYARGFGYRDLDDELPMTPDTLFAIGSTTKAMTSTVLGMLADEGLVDWDEPVRRYLPAFELADETISSRITPRDLVTHRSGLPRHDLVWYNFNDGSREALIDRLTHLEFTADLRERFQYNNLMYMTAGYLAGQLVGSTWEEVVRDRLFDPLGMNRSNFSVAASQEDSDHARPHREVDGELEEIPFRSIELIGQAGSVNSSVNEMARWIRFNLDGGRIDGKTLIDRATLADIHSAQITQPGASVQDDIVPVGYAMGWGVSVYRGHRMLSHGGGIDGFITSVRFFPDDDLGIVAFTNTGSNLGGLVSRTAADRVLGLEPRDWIGESLAEREQALAIQDEAEERRDADRRTDTEPSHTLESYAGVYEHPGYGRLVIALAEGRGEHALTMAYNGIEAPLEHWHYDVWNGAETDGDKTFEVMKLLFRSNFDGVIDAVEAPFERSASPVVFEKRPDPRLEDPAFLARFVGEYSDTVTGRSEQVTLAGDQLQLVLVGQPVYTLSPLVSGRFGIGELQGYTLGFTEDESGNITAITYYQPNGVFESKRVEE